MEENLYSFINSNNEFFFTTDSGRFDELTADGWQRAATAFDSYSGRGANRVYHLYLEENDRHFWTADKKEIKDLRSDGWQLLKSDSFSGSLEYKPGLVEVFRLQDPETLDSVWLTDNALIKDRTSNGWINHGPQWYAPNDDGKIHLSRKSVDFITGNISIDYALDDLHLSQFTEYTNTLTARLAGKTARNDEWIARDIYLRDLTSNATVDQVTGTITFNVNDALGKSLVEFEDLFISLNSKYGKADNGSYGFVRTYNTNLLDTNFAINESSDLKDIGYSNLYSYSAQSQESFAFASSQDIKPGGTYEEVNIQNQDLHGADWSNVEFKGSGITGNNLTAANLNSMKTDWLESGKTKKVSFNEPTYWWNNNMSYASMDRTNFIVHGLKLETQFMGDLTGASNFTMRMEVGGKNGDAIVYGRPSAMKIWNRSGKDVTLALRSPQFAYNKSVIPNNTGVSIFGYAKGSDTDTWGWIQKQGQSRIDLSTNNPPVLSESLFVNGRDVDDVGSFSYINWDYTKNLAQVHNIWIN